MCVEVRKCEFGYGVFATEVLEPDHWIGPVEGVVTTDLSMDMWHCFDYEDGERCFVPLGYFRYINHSCDPNCDHDYDGEGDEKELWIYIEKRIEVGEQLTIDYGEEWWAVKCDCGSEQCRGWIGQPQQPEVVGEEE